MTRAGDDRTGRWQSVVQTLIMPVWAAITAALGSYYGVLNTISELQAEVRVVQAEYRATMRAVDRRLEKIEADLPRAVATQEDLATLRREIDRTAEAWVERHEQAYHQAGGRAK